MAKFTKTGKPVGRPRIEGGTINDASATAHVSAIGTKELAKMQKSIKNYSEFISWARWYPDLFLDLIKPETGSITLHLDQRIFLRSIMRFMAMYGVFARSYAKTFNEVLCLILTAILFPGIDLAITAQTQENAAKLLSAKYSEIMKYYPMLEGEIYKKSFIKGEGEIIFQNKSVINVLANSQSSKGQRRRRVAMEEAALLNNEVFDDALKPIVDTARRTVGVRSIIDPCELNHQINFFTTAGFRASYEYTRCLTMVKSMKNLNGMIVLGADWHLGCWYERGLTKPQILERKETSTAISFAQNYMEQWVGCSSGALVDIQKLLNTRTLPKAEIKGDPNGEYYLGVDVARSIKSGNNLTAITPVKVIRNAKGKIQECQLVNIYEVSNMSNLTVQAIEIKRVKNLFNARAVCVDTNGLGIGLLDKLMEDTIDPITNESLGCWNTINTDSVPELKNSERCLYDLKPQSANSQIITNFIDMVESGKLKLLVKKSPADYDISDSENQRENVLPFVLTDALIEETANLKLKIMDRGGLGIEMVVKGCTKDKFSALEYALWYINTFESGTNRSEDEDLAGLLACIMT